MSTATKEIPGEPITLTTVQDKNGQADASVPIRWCPSREVTEALFKKRVDDAKIVLVVESNGEEMDRYVAPLEAEMRYIQFRRPGKNTVHAMIMYPNGKGSVKKLIKAKNEGEYKSALLFRSKPGADRIESQLDELRSKMWKLEEEAGEDDQAVVAMRAEIDQLGAALKDARENEEWQQNLRSNYTNLNSIGESVQLDVVVPEELFAGEPPRWMKWLGTRYDGLFWEQDARDQCQLRRRATITAPTLPFVTLFMIAIMAIVEVFQIAAVGVLLFFGTRNLNFTPLKQPFLDDPRDIWRNTKPSFWLYKEIKDEDEIGGYRYEYRDPVWQIVNLPVVVICSLAGYAIYQLSELKVFLIIGLSAAFALGLVVLIIQLIASRWPDPDPEQEAKRQKEKQKRKEERERQKAEALRKELEQLACTSANREASISALPKEHRTVYLRYQALKVKVCRPFAR